MSVPRRILVLDDDPVMCDLLTDILTASYDVTTECDPLATVQNIDCNRLDLLIIDLNMPGLTGEEAISQIRVKSACHNLPIMVLSASQNIHERVAGLDVQAAMGKPFQLNKLLGTIASLLPPENANPLPRNRD